MSRAHAAPATSIAGAAGPFGGIDEAQRDALLEGIGSARVMLLGEASHGIAECRRMRSALPANPVSSCTCASHRG